MAELLTLDELRALPDDMMVVPDPVIYFLWKGDELLYIGATTQFSDRYGKHVREKRYLGRIPFDRYTLLYPPDPRNLWHLETEYHQRYSPPFCDDGGVRKRRFIPQQLLDEHDERVAAGLPHTLTP